MDSTPTTSIREPTGYSCCKPCSRKIWCILKVIMCFYPWLDMATNIVVMLEWKSFTDRGMLESTWWILGVIFLVLPTVAVTCEAIYWWHKGEEFIIILGSPVGRGKSILFALGYIIILPLAKLKVNIKSLVREFSQEEASRDDEDELQLNHFFTQVEAWLESVPQAVLQWTLIGLEPQIYPSEFTWDNVLSSKEFAIFSAAISTFYALFASYQGARGCGYWKSDIPQSPSPISTSV